MPVDPELRERVAVVSGVARPPGAERYDLRVAVELVEVVGEDTAQG